MLHIKNLLNKSIKKSGTAMQIEAALVLKQFEKELKKLMGEEIGEKVKAVSLKNQSLTVAVLSSVMASEIKLREPDIIEAINRFFDREVVKSLRFIH